MHDVHDWWMKGIVAGTLRGSCRVALEDEVLADKARIDAWVEPDPMQLGTLDARGLIGRMAKRPGSIETTWGALSANTLDDHLQKVIIKHQGQRKLAEELRKKGLPYAVPVRPISWTIGTGLSKTLLADWGLAPMDRAHWPDGVYWGGGPYTPHVVIASLLPATRDTMLVRLMAGGKTFARAMRDLLALPSTEWEWEVVDPILRKLKGDLARLGLDVYDQEDEDAKMTAAEIYELFDEYDRQKREQQEALRRMRESVMQARAEELARPLTDAERTRFETMTAAEIYELFDEYDHQKREQQEALRRMRESVMQARVEELSRPLTDAERTRFETMTAAEIYELFDEYDRQKHEQQEALRRMRESVMQARAEELARPLSDAERMRFETMTAAEIYELFDEYDRQKHEQQEALRRMRESVMQARAEELSRPLTDAERTRFETMTAAEIYELFDEYDRQKHEQQEALRRMRESVMQARAEELARPLSDAERMRFETMTAAEIYELFDEYDRQKHEQQEALRRMRESVMQARAEELARPLSDAERTRFETMTAAEIYELFDEYDRQKHEQQEALRRMRESVMQARAEELARPLSDAERTRFETMTAAEIYELFDEYDRQKRERRETVTHLLARLFSQKLGRDLTEDEQRTLRRRIETLGSERVGDVVLAFDRDALGAWLARPDAG